MKGAKRKKREPSLTDYPPHLRGFSTNRWGGHSATRLRTYGGCDRTPGPVKQFTEEQRLEWAKRNEKFLGKPLQKTQ